MTSKTLSKQGDGGGRGGGRRKERAPEQDFHHSPLDPVCRLTHEPPVQHGVQLESREDGRMGGGGVGVGEEVRRGE